MEAVLKNLSDLHANLTELLEPHQIGDRDSSLLDIAIRAYGGLYKSDLVRIRQIIQNPKGIPSIPIRQNPNSPWNTLVDDFQRLIEQYWTIYQPDYDGLMDRVCKDLKESVHTNVPTTNTSTLTNNINIYDAIHILMSEFSNEAAIKAKQEFSANTLSVSQAVQMISQAENRLTPQRRRLLAKVRATLERHPIMIEATLRAVEIYLDEDDTHQMDTSTSGEAGARELQNQIDVLTVQLTQYQQILVERAEASNHDQRLDFYYTIRKFKDLYRIFQTILNLPELHINEQLSQAAIRVDLENLQSSLNTFIQRFQIVKKVYISNAAFDVSKMSMADGLMQLVVTFREFVAAALIWIANAEPNVVDLMRLVDELQLIITRLSLDLISYTTTITVEYNNTHSIQDNVDVGGAAAAAAASILQEDEIERPRHSPITLPSRPDRALDLFHTNRNLVEEQQTQRRNTLRSNQVAVRENQVNQNRGIDTSNIL